MATAATNKKIRRARGRPLTAAEKRNKRGGTKAKPRAKWHGTVNGYTNHKCRCKKCRAAMARYQSEYRERRFEGQTCAKKGCTRPPSRAKGNGLCFRCDKETRT